MIEPVRSTSDTPMRRPAKLSEHLARDIVAEIVGRGMAAGDTLPAESTMLARFGVGRASLREALRILEVQGIITIKPGPGGGPVVASSGASEFGRMMTLHLQVRRAPYRNVVEARLAVEPTMARLAAERSDATTAARLRDHLASAAAIADHDDAAIVDAWAQFHDLVCELSGNGVMALFASGLQDVYRERVSEREVAAGARRDPRRNSDADREHAAIAKSIISGNAARAERLMREHMETFSAAVEARNPTVLDEIITWQ